METPASGTSQGAVMNEQTPEQPPSVPPSGSTGPPGPTGPDWRQAAGRLGQARGPDRLILVAGLLLFVDSFLPWYGVKGVVAALLRAAGASPNVRGWSAGGLAVLAILCALAATGVAAAGVVGAARPSRDLAVLTLALAGGSLVFVLLRFLTQMDFARYGLYAAIVLAAVMTYGAYRKYRAQA
jgi:hypothetical protein